MESKLKDLGWHLNEEGLKIAAGGGNGKGNASTIEKKFLDLDIKEIGVGFLSEEINRGKCDKVSSGNFVLQVRNIRNISAPKAKEDSSLAPRMLKITLTDGTTTIHAVESQKLAQVSLNTPPGTKIRFKGDSIHIQNGFLQLESNSCLEVLGGKVTHLVEKWEISRELDKFTRAARSCSTSGADAAPAWIPFGKKITSNLSTKDFKALNNAPTTSAASAAAANGGEDTAEFDNQRKDAIEEASKGNQKVFGGGHKEIKDGSHHGRRTRKEATPTDGNNPEAAQDVKGGRREKKGGKGGRKGAAAAGDDENKPAANVSLFDFLEEKIPASTSTSGETNLQPNKSDIHKKMNRETSFHNTKNNRKPTNNNSGTVNNHNQHSKQQKNNEQKQHKENRDYSAKKPQHQQQPRGGDKSNGNKNGGTGKGHSDRDFGEWSNSTYHDTQQHKNHNNRNHNNHHLNDQFSSMNLNNHQRNHHQNNQSSKQQQHGDRKHNKNGGGNNWNGHWQPKQQQQRRNPEWKVGDDCLAKYWEDENFYQVRITAVGPQTAVVVFLEYGNHEEVLLTDLRPLTGSGGGGNYHHNNHHQRRNNKNYIPATPGLPPAFPQS